MKILVLAGGADQIALINEFKARGHETILVDYFENPPARPYADKHIVASTLDVERVKEIAIDQKVDLITTACTDQALLTVANVSEQLNLPCYLSYQTGLNVTNKSYMKNVLFANNIPTAKFVILDKVDLDAVKDFSLPLVVKPVDCNSSKGVKRIDDIVDITKYLEEAIKLSRTKKAIVEEFKTGNEISVDYYVEGCEAKLLCATTSLKIKNSKSFTILCSDYPAINEEQEELLKVIGNQVAKAFGLKDCPLFIQMIANGTDVNVIEFSARMGGGSKYNLIRVLSGVNIMSKYVDLVLGGKPSVSPSKLVSFCKMVYLYCNPGVFDHIEGLEELKQQGIIDSYFEYKTKGMEISHAETSGDRPAGYLITAETADALQEKLNYVDSHIKVVSDKGEDIMMHNLLA
ncbi:hypothetical protein CIK99_14385 [Prevotella sp. P5-92]|uniref:ATP-grasp domain-containing protein n=1 Tax=Prevotella sp. P5-92 TaxID=2024222 RepID=UPI000B969D76|nr:ATP-grasp domain-containing protein [Prevotella sp. P5-92]OYP54264.1 hypothetical protein CIK99_14385 [Prevotella sp. P5-92]